MSKLRILLLGTPQLWLEDTAVVFKTRKSLALLAYLLAEGGQARREQLTALLWPDKEEAQARNSLRQTLTLLRETLGESYLHITREQLGFNFSSEHQLDLDGFKTGGSVESLEAALKLYRGEFLLGLELDDAPEFGDWVQTWRELFRNRLEFILEQLSQHYLSAGNGPQVLEVLLRWRQLDTLAELPHRHLIAWYLERHNRNAALKVFLDYRYMCEREDLELSEAMLMLGQQLEVRSWQGGKTGSPANSTHPLVGREREWVLMEEGWKTGQHIFVSGEPGVGKTRLMMEFAATKGAFASHLGRPGDQAVPFSSIARGMQHILQTHANLELPAWARRELSRLVPQLRDDKSKSLHPLSSKEDRLRLFQAAECLYDSLRSRGLYPLGDDLQFSDESSMELLEYLIAQAPKHRLHSGLSAFRRGEVSARFIGMVEQMVGAGHAALIELGPLQPEAVGQMLETLLPAGADADPLGYALHHFTGGNPLFIHETVQALLEQGGPPALTPQNLETLRREALPSRLPRVNTVIRQRFERLSREALDVIRIAATAGQEFSLFLAEEVARLDKLHLARVMEELEAAQVFKANRFTHDLLYETALGMVSAPARQLLSRAVLEALKDKDTHPFRLLHFAIQTGDGEQILQHGLQAIHEALKLFAHQEITHLVQQGVELLLQQQRKKDAALLLTELGRVAFHMGWVLESRGMLDEATRLYQQLGEWKGIAEIALELSEASRVFGAYAEARTQAEQALTTFRNLHHPSGACRALELLGEAQWWLRNFQQAQACFSEAYSMSRELGNPQAEAWMLKNLGQTEYFLEDPLKARTLMQQSLELIRQLPDPTDIAWVHFDLGRLLLVLAEFEQARIHHQEALDIFVKIHHKDGRVIARVELGNLAVIMGDLAQAKLIWSQVVQPALEIGGADLLTDLLSFGATLLYQQKRFELSAELLGKILAEPLGNPFTHVRARQLLDALEGVLPANTLKFALAHGANQQSETLIRRVESSFQRLPKEGEQ